MRTVRAKLIAIVAVCVIPAIFGALLRAREAQRELVEQVRDRMDKVDDAFIADLINDTAQTAVALHLAAGNQRLIKRLTGEETAGGIPRSLRDLAKAYPGTTVILADAEGKTVTATPPRHAPELLSTAAVPALEPLWRGEPFAGLVPISPSGGNGYSLAVAEPVKDGDTLLGGLVMLSPFDGAFFDREVLRLGSHFALRMNGELVVSDRGNPEPSLSVNTEAVQTEGVVELRTVGDRFFAINSFAPFRAPLHDLPGQVTIMTASRDVTALRAPIRHDLVRSLIILGIALAGALALALAIGHGMHSTTARIARAAKALREGRYESVDGAPANDELGQLAQTFNQMVAGLRERDELKETFGKYVSRQVAEHVLRRKGLGGENVMVTVLFSDIRGFTTISEHMEPKALLDFLNVYFTGMVEAVMRQQGVVDKFIGDAIMAVYGAPEPHPDDALRAVRSALEMRARLKELNQGFRAKGLPEIRFGIGIHTGAVVAGNMGHVDRREYTVIGDSVNVASRLEGLTKELGCDILISEDTFRQVEQYVQAEALQPTHVKGRQQEVMVYKLVGLREGAVKAA